MKSLLIFLCVFAVSSTVLAIPGGPAFEGVRAKLSKCYSRVYTPAHLASHPNQQIVKMAAKFSYSTYKNEDGQKETISSLKIQAKKRGSSTVYAVDMPCYQDPEDSTKTRCAIDCDGPNVEAYFSTNNPGKMLIDNTDGYLALNSTLCGDDVSDDEFNAYALILNNAKGADDKFLLFPWVKDDYKCL